jgi:hypothetical protein
MGRQLGANGVLTIFVLYGSLGCRRANASKLTRG